MQASLGAAAGGTVGLFTASPVFRATVAVMTVAVGVIPSANR